MLALLGNNLRTLLGMPYGNALLHALETNASRGASQVGTCLWSVRWARESRPAAMRQQSAASILDSGVDT